MTQSVLVVDDDDRLLHVLAVFFELKGYEVRTAAGGLAALKSIDQQRPDLVVIDVLMPDLDGLEVTRRLRSDHKSNRLPIVGMAADRDLEKASIAAGADAFVSKPFDLDELAAPVAKLLAATHSSAIAAIVTRCGARSTNGN